MRCRVIPALNSVLSRRLAISGNNCFYIRSSFHGERATRLSQLRHVSHNSSVAEHGALKDIETIERTPQKAFITVLAHQPNITRPDDILSRLYLVPKITTLQWQPMLVFFLTPTFAKWLGEDETFIRPAIARMLGDRGEQIIRPSKISSLGVLIAVIDRLSPTAIIDSTDTKDEVVDKDGHEGVSCMLTDRRAISFRPETSGIDGVEKHLTFICETGNQSLKREPDTWRHDLQRMVVKFPLANTIFQTGKTATLTYSDWQLTEALHGWSRAQEAEDLASASLTWPYDSPATLQREYSTVETSLMPLTVPRKVDGVMGNILRTLEREDGKIVPASRELEEAVSGYFTARSVDPHTLSAWALVFPGRASMPSNRTFETQQQVEDNFRPDSLKCDGSIMESLSHGARLHRILSGGGGWGKKAGLLSLDPDLGMFERMLSEPELTKRESKDEDETHNIGALTEIAKPGDMIQFFVSPPRSSSRPLQKSRPSKMKRHSLGIGVVPSTVDHQSVSRIQDSSRLAQFTTATGGANILTESALHFLLEYQSQRHSNFETLMYTTKWDVPYSRFFQRAKVVGTNGTKLSGTARGGSPQKGHAKVSRPPVSKVALSEKKRFLRITFKELSGTARRESPRIRPVNHDFPFVRKVASPREKPPRKINPIAKQAPRGLSAADFRDGL
ncbi:MAG: hypothetical protein M1820_008424 [Bogoriella megaspora]|nr:MAG: hypothetical protein M1820_008424 [Bogoriella megaspora]